MKILTIVGNRPHFMKAAVVSRALTLSNGNPHRKAVEIILHTGQHYDYNMSGAFLECLNMPTPDYNLNVGPGKPEEVIAAMKGGIEKALIKERPDWVLVYGDTNSTLAGSLAASKLQIPVAHVEAGLRSFNNSMPEERNRVVTDHVSQLLYAPTDTAVANLKREGITRGVIKSGDVMLDAFLHFKAKAEKCSSILEQLRLLKDHYLLATVHRQANTDDAQKLINIFSAFEELSQLNRPVILPLHPRTRKKLQQHKIPLDRFPKVRIIEPVTYLDMIQLEVNANMILTDSGGVQKEACFAGVPCITLREETEWVETVDSGINLIVGTDKHAILEGTTKVAKKSDNLSFDLYGDGNAGRIIVENLFEVTYSERCYAKFRNGKNISEIK